MKKDTSIKIDASKLEVAMEGHKYRFKNGVFSYDGRQYNLFKISDQERLSLAHAIIEVEGQTILVHIESSPEELPAAPNESLTA